MRLKDKYQKEVVPEIMKRFGYRSHLAVPRIERVVINIGVGKLISGKTSKEQGNILKGILEDLAQISGQRGVLTKARKSISTFKIRKGMPVGIMVTLRKKMMYDFLERLIHIVLPRLRDFRGIPESSFDRYGNLTIGIKEHTTFPEVLAEKTKNIFGLEITVVVKSKTREESILLFRLMGFPIKEKK